MKQKVAALLLVAIMTLSACAAVGLTATKAGTITTQTATATDAAQPPFVKVSGSTGLITATPNVVQPTTTNTVGTAMAANLSFYMPSRLNVKEPFWVSGKLTDSKGNPLANQVIWEQYYAGAGKWANMGSVKTDSTGFYFDTWWSTGFFAAKLRTHFDGTAYYKSKNSSAVTSVSKVRTTMPLTGPSGVHSRDEVMVGGMLKDEYANQWLGNAPVDIYYKYAGQSSWTHWTSGATLSDGSLYIKDQPFLGGASSMSYYISYAGNATYWPCTSDVVTVKNLG